MRSILVAILIFGSLLNVHGQTDTGSAGVSFDVQSIALLALSDTGTITLSPQPPLLAGEDLEDDEDSSLLLQVTSIVPVGTTRNITVNWNVGDSIPAGTRLHVRATSTGGGMGVREGWIEISDTAQVLFSGVTSDATGTGTRGVALRYRLRTSNMTRLRGGDVANVTVTYTLTDAP
jgi:hypothetical protein